MLRSGKPLRRARIPQVLLGGYYAVTSFRGECVLLVNNFLSYLICWTKHRIKYVLHNVYIVYAFEETSISRILKDQEIKRKDIFYLFLIIPPLIFFWMFSFHEFLHLLGCKLIGLEGELISYNCTNCEGILNENISNIERIIYFGMPYFVDLLFLVILYLFKIMIFIWFFIHNPRKYWL